jgi:hypothetical protein
MHTQRVLDDLEDWLPVVRVEARPLGHPDRGEATPRVARAQELGGIRRVEGDQVADLVALGLGDRRALPRPHPPHAGVAGRDDERALVTAHARARARRRGARPGGPEGSGSPSGRCGSTARASLRIAGQEGAGPSSRGSVRRRSAICRCREYTVRGTIKWRRVACQDGGVSTYCLASRGWPFRHRSVAASRDMPSLRWAGALEHLGPHHQDPR